MVSHTLVVRMDNAGDVLLAGPAIRAIAHGSDRVTALVGPLGAEAARLLPGIDDVLVWRCPWIDLGAHSVQREDVEALAGMVAGAGADRAVILTSFHQSPLPTALVLRMAGVEWIGAISVDFPGALLDLRHRVDEMLPEAERGLSLAMAAGFSLPPGDRGLLEVRQPLPDVSSHVPAAPFVVLHPGTSVPARAWPAPRFAATAEALAAAGHHVVVTGSPSERRLTAEVVGPTESTDLGGRTTLPELAAVLAAADVVVVGNTGPAHLASAVGTPVVSLFAPTVPAQRWAPYGVPAVVLGDQHAPCRDSRVTTCPFPGHPCLGAVSVEDVLDAVHRLSSRGPVHATHAQAVGVGRSS
jgi:ADP-heptose:LPS heptosyltransferase